MRYTAEVYWKDGCSKCGLTMRQLKLPYKPIKVNQQNIEELKEKWEVRTLPFVVIYQDGKMVDHWKDFQFSKIQYWNEKVK